jgi:hypothetical protein
MATGQDQIKFKKYYQVDVVGYMVNQHISPTIVFYDFRDIPMKQLKTYKLRRIDSGLICTYRAEADMGEFHPELRGLLLNPKLPGHFWMKPIWERSKNELNHWEYLNFVIYDKSYGVYCLDHGAWDRPTIMGGFLSIDELVSYFRKICNENKDKYTAFKEIRSERNNVN